MHDLAVVGAGLSGLAVAREAVSRGLDVVVLEARARLGGRVLGHRTPAGIYDLGPAWVWPALQPRIARLVAEAGLTLFEQTEAGAFVFQDASGRTQVLPHGYAQEPPSMRIVGGITALVEAVARSLPPTTVRLQHHVQDIRLGDSGVEIAVQAPDGPVALSASRVVLAIPPRQIPKLGFAPELPPPLTARIAATPGWMAGQAKALALYDRAAWRERHFSGSAFSQAGPLGELHEAGLPGASEGALVGFFAWSPQWRDAHRASLHSLVAQQLGALFGDAAGQPREIIVQDWASESFTATEADQAPLREHPDFRPCALPSPWGNRMVLAGSEFAPESGGYLEGALAAAEAAFRA